MAAPSAAVLMPINLSVMPALVVGIHVFLFGQITQKDVDGRVKPGHDERKNLLVRTSTYPPLR